MYGFRLSKSKRYLRAAWEAKEAAKAIVVGNEAAQTPFLYIKFSLFSTNANGGLQTKQEVSPGKMNE